MFIPLTKIEQHQRLPKVGGISAFTATDFPGKLSIVLFMQGCPWQCGYCHNPHLQARTTEAVISWPNVMDLLKRRQGLLDAVVFSGGEPTTDPALAWAMQEVRQLGFQIGLHTAGTYPERLKQVLPLVDWVGIDVKTNFEQYDALTQTKGSAKAAYASVDAVLQSGVAYEVRTTSHPSYLSEDNILTLTDTLVDMGVSNYCLQIFRQIGCADSGLSAVNTKAYISAATISNLKQKFTHFNLRAEH
jgi:pyruvate formate lyase activating enzyme